MDVYKKFEYPLPNLTITPSNIIIEASGKYEGSFYVENSGGSLLDGTVVSKHECLFVTDKKFTANKALISFTVDPSDLSQGTVVETKVVVSSNGGEKALPIIIKVVPHFIDMPNNYRITSVEEFYDYAKTHRLEARELFYSPKFKSWLISMNYVYMDVFNTIIKDKDEERALENFFVLNKCKKQLLSVESSDCKDVPAVAPTKNASAFTMNISKTEFQNNERGSLAIINNRQNDIKVFLSSEDGLVKFDKPELMVQNQSKIYFTTKLTAVQTARSGIKKLPFVKDKIYIKVLSGTKIINKEIDINIGEVNFKGFEKQIAAGLGHLLYYRISDDTKQLEKAMTYARKWLDVQSTPVPALMFSVLTHIELGDIKTAESILHSVLKYKNYYKSNDSEIYGLLLLLSALCNLKAGNLAAYDRDVKILTECAKSQSHFVFPLALGVLAFDEGSLKHACKHFMNSYAKGCRSSYLAGYLYKLFSKETEAEALPLLNWFINWALAKDIGIHSIITRNKKWLADNLFFESGVLYKLYDKYKLEFLLEVICKAFIANDDCGAVAYGYYKEAERRQLHPNGLWRLIVLSAKNASDEDVSRYAMMKFLDGGLQKLDDDIAPFVYHLILTDKRHDEFFEPYRRKIIECGISSLNSDRRGRYYNSLYKFMLDAAKTDASLAKHTDALERALQNSLFYYSANLVNKSVTHIWISEKERKDTRVYAVAGGQTKIKAVNDFFNYVCYDIRSGTIVNEKLELRKLIENADIELYLRFYRKSVFNDDLLIALSRHIIESGPNFPESADILKRTSRLSGISNSFRMQVYAAVANIMYEQGNHAEALEYYLIVDEQYIVGNHLERMLDYLLKSNSYDKVCSLVNKKAGYISDAVLLNAITQISENAKYAPKAASVAYNLLMRGQYSPLLLGTVIKYYIGSIEDWETLYEALAKLAIMSSELAELIISNSVYSHHLSLTAQNAFVSLYNLDYQNKFIELFTYYCIYEIIINNAKLKYDVIDVLEKIYDTGKDKLLSYALCAYYCENGIRSSKSVGIIKDAAEYMESEGFVLPAMKKCNIPEAITPYVQKKQAFSYRSRPDASVFLHYKLAGHDEFKIKPMKYLRFGVYLASVTMFYGDEIVYCISEETRSGSVVTEEMSFVNDTVHGAEDLGGFTSINNCLIYMENFRFDKAENIISDYLKQPKVVISKML